MAAWRLGSENAGILRTEQGDYVDRRDTGVMGRAGVICYHDFGDTIQDQQLPQRSLAAEVNATIGINLRNELMECDDWK